MSTTLLTLGNTTLRAWQEPDIAVMQELRNNVALQLQLMTHPTPNSEQQVRAWLIRRSQEPDTVFFVIAEQAQAIGYIQLVAMSEMSAMNRCGRLGICLAPDAQGRGHGMAAIQLLESHGAQQLNLRKIVLEVLVDNQSALQLYRRLGYQQCGYLHAHFCAHEKFHDVILMEKFLSS